MASFVSTCKLLEFEVWLAGTTDADVFVGFFFFQLTLHVSRFFKHQMSGYRVSPVEMMGEVPD